MTKFTVGGDATATVVVIGLRDAPSLVRCLESLAANVREIAYEVRVVLCDPTERLRADLERKVDGAHVHPFRANLGFAQAANFAISRSPTEFVVLLNDDTVVHPGWLEALLDTARRRSRAGVVTGKYLHMDGSLQEAGSVLWSDGSTSAVGDGSIEPLIDFERRVDYGSGGSMLIRREVWDLVGGLPDCYYPAYFEDVDFCLSAAEHGWETWYQPEALVSHERSSSSDVHIRSLIWTRAREMFSRRWGHVLDQRAVNGQIEQAVWKAMGSPTRVLVIDDMIPDPAIGSGYGRMFDSLCSLARATDLYVSFHPRMPSASETLPVPGVRLVRDLASHLATEGVSYDIVVVSRPHNGQIFKDLLSRMCPDSTIVYDAEALFHRRLEMQAEMSSGPARRELLEEADRMRAIERTLLIEADHAVCISEAEAEAARQLAPTPVDVVSPLLETPSPTPADFRERSAIGFVAGWAAGPGSPNSDALQWLAVDVMPRLRSRISNARVRVTGFNPPAEVRRYSGSSVEFTGEIKDLRRFYNGIRVAVSPTRFGAGVKIKTVEAIQYGVPVVCTSEAAAGLPPRLRNAVWIADDPTAFADAVATLLTDERAWHHRRRLALEAVVATSDTDAEEPEQWPTIIRKLAANRLVSTGSSDTTR